MSYIAYAVRFYEAGSSTPDRTLSDDGSVFGDPSWDKEGPPGYTAATLMISKAEFEANPTVYAYGTTIEIINTADADDVVWAGKLLKPTPGVGTNKVKLVAHGWGKKATKTLRKWLWQTRDEQEWHPGDSDPFNYAVSGLIEARVEGRRLEFRVRKNTTFKKTSGGSPATWRSTLVFYGDGRNLRRLAFDWEQEHDDDYYLEVCKATGPAGALTVIDTIGLGATSGSYNSGSVTNWDTNPFDLFAVRLCRDDEVKKSDGWWLKLTNVKVNGEHTAADSYETYKIVRDIADAVGGDTTGINSTIKNGLPFAPGRVPASDALDAIAMLDDRVWLLLGDKDPAWRYRDWDVKTWEISDPYITFEPTSVERISKVYCPYQTADGVQRFTSAEVPGSEGITTEFTIPLTDPLPPKSAADIVCAVFAAYYAEDRYFAQVQTAWIEDTANPGVKVPATRAEPGDSVVVAGLTLRAGRLEGVEGPMVRFTFPELDYLLQRFLANRSLLIARGRSNRDATIDALGLGRPDLVEWTSIEGSFKRHRKKNHHTQVDIRIDWDAVTEDVRGNPTFIRAYRVQLRPVDGAGDPIPEADGGKILEKVIRDKDTGDGETLDTRIWFRDVERPFAWEWETRIETVDIQGKVSKNGTKSFTNWVNIGGPGSEFDPPAPLTVTLNMDPHVARGAWTAPADDEVSDEYDTRINRFFYKLKRPNGTTLRQGYTKDLNRNWRLNEKVVAGNYTLEIRSVDSEQRRSAIVSATNALGNPPDPLSAPTITVDLGGKKRRRITVTGTYSGSWTDNDVKVVHIRALIDGKTYNPKVRLDSDGTFSHVFHGLHKGDSYNIKYRVEDTKGNESGFSPAASGTLTDITPPAPENPVMVSRPKQVIVKGFKTAGDEGEVHHYEVEISTSSSTVAATFLASRVDYDVTDTGRIHFPRDKDDAPVYPRVRSVSDSGEVSAWVYRSGGSGADTAEFDGTFYTDSGSIYYRADSATTAAYAYTKAGAISGIISFGYTSLSDEHHLTLHPSQDSGDDRSEIKLYAGPNAEDDRIEISSSEIIQMNFGIGRTGGQMPGSIAVANEVWGWFGGWFACTKLDHAPASITTLSNDDNNNMDTITRTNFSNRGFLLKAEVTTTGTFIRLLQDYLSA